MNQSLLIADNLTGGYQTTSIIHQLNLHLDRGEWLSLLGGNGSGKSTLLKLLSRLLKPQHGLVWLDGKAIHTEPPNLVAQKMALLSTTDSTQSLRYQLELLNLLKDLQQQQWLTIITVLHELNLAIRFSDRLAMLKNGSLVTVGTPSMVITPEIVAEVFGVNMVTIDTPVGLQICPLSAR